MPLILNQKIRIVIGALLLLSLSNGVYAQSTAESPPGFYKDLFMSSGVNLSSRRKLFAAESLGLSYEYYAGKDAAIQNRIVAGDDRDTNGALLYPDGAPRFRMIYVNGGGATNHGKSLELSGRQTLRQFFNAGGSYCGSCAGSFFSGRNVDAATQKRLGYLHIYPYNTLNTGMKKARVGHVIPEESPLLKYRKFGADNYVEDIYHNNGNWMSREKGDHLDKTEVLAIYDTPGERPDLGAAIWAYKVKPETGRVVNIGSHPEGVEDGERLALTEACFMYCLDGGGVPAVKAELVSGETRLMNLSTEDKNPAFTKIGDGQFHHFRMVVPTDAVRTTIQLTAETDVDFHLFVRQGQLDLDRPADFQLTKPGSDKILRERLEPGVWFVTVECATRVAAAKDETDSFYVYSDSQDLLNGVPYRLMLDQKTRRHAPRVSGSVVSQNKEPSVP